MESLLGFRVDIWGCATFAVLALLLSEDGPWGDDTVNSSYTSRLRAGLSVQQPNAAAWSQSYSYDAMKRLTNLMSPAGAFGYSYNIGASASPGGLIRKLTLPHGAYITNEFDAVARLTSTVLYNSPDVPLNVHTYTYDLAGERTRQTRTDGSYVDYGYDPMGQLLSAKGKEPGGSTNRLHEQLSYVYDAAGNLTWRTNNALVQQFQVNSLNELITLGRSGTLTVAGTTTSLATNVAVNTLAAELYGDATFAKAGFTVASGDNTFTAIAQDAYGRVDTNTVTAYLPASANLAYDLNGNLTNDARRVFAYDDENQLIQVLVTNASGQVTKSDFGYDGKLRRRVRTEAALSGGGWVTNLIVRYVYDGNLVIQERHYTPQISTTIPQDVVTYTRGKDLSGSLEGAGGIGGLLARSSSGETYSPNAAACYHADGNGNVTCLLNANQVVVAPYLYDPYGNLLSLSGSLADVNLYRFSSKEYHAASRLYFYLYRWYDPGTQRWMNRDPMGDFSNCAAIQGRASDGSGGKLHAIAANDPSNRVDPLGLWCWTTGKPDPDPRANASCQAICRILHFALGCWSGGSGSAVRITTSCLTWHWTPIPHPDATIMWMTVCRCSLPIGNATFYDGLYPYM